MSSLSDEQSRRVKRQLPLLLVVALAIFYIVITRPSVDSTEAEGNYINACCPAVTIRNGHLNFRGEAIPIKFKRMKFGIAGYPERPFDGFYIQDTATGERLAPILVFSDDFSSFTAVGPSGAEYKFERK